MHRDMCLAAYSNYEVNEQHEWQEKQRSNAIREKKGA